MFLIELRKKLDNSDEMVSKKIFLFFELCFEDVI